MSEEDLKKLFEDAGSTPVDPAAATRAQQAALDVYKKEVSEKINLPGQESTGTDRPTAEVHEIRRSRMSSLSQTFFDPGAWRHLATAAAVVVAVTVVLNLDLSDPARPLLEVEPELVSDNAAITAGSGLPESQSVKTEDRRPGEAEVQYALEEKRRKALVSKEASSRQLADATVSRTNQVAPMVMEEAFSPTGMLKPEPLMPGLPDAVGRDQFEILETNAVKRVVDEPVSTFSIDVDTASYSFVRRQLNQGVLPQKDAVRLEEMVNYFPYEYPVPEDTTQPFATSVTVLDAPWRPGNKLLHIGIQGYDLPTTALPRSNLVFLLDVSGSMNNPDKLPLVKQSMGMLLDSLSPEDTVSIVVYAGAAGTVLEPTPVREKSKILNAMQRLSAGGSTAGGAGIRLAYQLAEANFVEDGVNRVILATDGDFNVGITKHEELKGFVERKRDTGIYLSVLGFGQGNYNDRLMQVLAQNGNGVAAYIDTLSEAQKVLVDEASSTLFPIAKDVKIQVEFNPATVSEYRLLGYETRLLNREDFNNDKVDAGEIGAGHSVTAIYEFTPRGTGGLIDEPRYTGNQADMSSGSNNSEYAFVRTRYKLPDAEASQLLTRVVPVGEDTGLKAPASEVNFAVAVAGFAQLLRNAEYTGNWSLDDALELALNNRGEDRFGYRAELVQLIRKARVASALPE